MRDGWYQVMSRSNGGEAIYRTNEDRRRFLGRVAELPDRFWTETPAFVLMENSQDCGRDGTMAVATRHLGRRLADVVREVPGLKYAAAAQGIRRFWRRAEDSTELAAFSRRLKSKCQICNV